MFAWIGPFYDWLTSRKVVRVLLWVLHALAVAAIAAALWWLNHRYRVETELLSPFPRLHAFWLPLLFLLVYAGAWLGYWFFRLLTDPRDGEFPDIEAAWADGLAALDRAGIDPAVVPLVLVVGRPAGGMADFFAATRLPLAVRDEPRRPDAPVKVHATRDAVFVTCEDASVLSRFSLELATRARAKAVEPAALKPVQTAPAAPAPGTREWAAARAEANFQTRMKAEATGTAHRAVSAAAGPLPGLEPTNFAVPTLVNLLDSPEAPAPVVAGDPQPAAGPTATPSGDALELYDWLPEPGTGEAHAVSADEADRQAARLRYLCRLIGDRRRPYCSANGVIWLLPVAGTESDAAADQTAAACRADAAAIRAGLQVHLPSVAVVADAQELPGFRDLLRGLPDPLVRERLLGRSFPLVPNVAPDRRQEVWAGGLDWVARHLVPGVVYQRFGTEAEGNGERWSEANARLWRLAAEVYDRREAVARLVGQGIAGGADRPPMLAGVFLAGTGPDERDQAFAAGVVAQLLALQNHVTWTDAAAAEETDYRRMTAIGYTAAVALVVGVGAFAYRAWVR